MNSLFLPFLLVLLVLYAVKGLPFENDDCAICQDDLFSKPVTITTACNHEFHEECFDKWLDTTGDNPTCPMCRSPVLHIRSIDEWRRYMKQAATTGDEVLYEYVSGLFDGHINDALDSNWKTALHLATEYGSYSILFNMLNRSDLNVNAKDKNGQTPLHYAAYKGRIHVVKALLQRTDLQVDAEDERGKRAIEYAADNGKVDIVSLLQGSNEDSYVLRIAKLMNKRINACDMENRLRRELCDSYQRSIR